MIKKFLIQNFKSHQNTDLEFSNLTVLCGSNAVGKSSVVHALLLLRESFLANSNFEYLDLKSNPVNVGTAQDALYQFGDTDEISFEITTESRKLVYSFQVDRLNLTKTLVHKTPESTHFTDKVALSSENIFNKNCQFISAARFGPQPLYIKDDVVVDIYNQISVIEGKAEHFLHYLNKHKNREVTPQLLNENIKASDLESQVTAWEREIAQGINVVVQDLGSSGYELKYQFNTSSGAGKTYEFRAANVGFGVTYVMPIIIAILAAEPGALLLIENPEAHLHPGGQAKLAELICLAAQNGIQIVIETHSDHIINGILLQCKSFEEGKKGIDKTNVSVYSLEKGDVLEETIVTKVIIENDGRIRYPPRGFFDQFTIDRKKLIGF